MTGGAEGVTEAVEEAEKQTLGMTAAVDETAVLVQDENDHGERVSLLSAAHETAHGYGVLCLVGDETAFEKETSELLGNDCADAYAYGCHNGRVGGTRRSAVEKTLLGPPYVGDPSAGLHHY